MRLTSHQYDTEDGISETLVDLKSLHKIFDARHESYYQRREFLGDFIVLGMWNLDSCGNAMKATKDFIPRVEFSNFPPVLTSEHFWGMVKRESGNDVWCSFGYRSELPPHDKVCPHCGRGWTLYNCHDAVEKRETEIVCLKEFVGRTLAEVRAEFDKRFNDRSMRMRRDLLIRNDKYIDLTPDPKYDTIVANRGGWKCEDDGFCFETYVIQEGDDAHFDTKRYYHGKCNQQVLLVAAIESFTDMFKKAGHKDVHIFKIKNEYCHEPSCSSCWPWFLVNSHIGTIKIGWRKRVINIDTSSETISKQLVLRDLFSDQDVTKGADYIHAHGDEKAIEYLVKIREAVEEIDEICH